MLLEKNLSRFRETSSDLSNGSKFSLPGAHRFRGILEGVGITAKNLYWCPNDLKEAEKDVLPELSWDWLYHAVAIKVFTSLRDEDRPH